jgi:hypothetical protein
MRQESKSSIGREREMNLAMDGTGNSTSAIFAVTASANGEMEGR